MANPTTNFGWVMPTSSSLVTNLPADFNTFGQAVDTSMSELLGGTTGQVLSKTSATNMDFTWVTPTDQTPLTTKGDLFTFTTVDARLAVGSNGETLVADSSTATGLKWATPSSPSYVGVMCYIQGSAVSYTDSVAKQLSFTTESFDTNTFHDNSTNTSRITIPTGYSGKYLIDMSFGCDTAGTFGNINLYKNGSNITNIGVDGGKIGGASGMTSNYYVARANAVIALTAGDYIEFYITIGSTVSTGTYARFGATFLGA